MNHDPSDNWQRVETGLSSMLARIERRQLAAPATPEDGCLNDELRANLARAVSLTDRFRAVRGGGLEVQANGLAAAADATTSMVAMARALQNAPRLSPLFERMMNREYDEVVGLMGQVRDAVVESSQQLLAAAEKNPPPARPVDPFVAAWGMVLAPSVMAWQMTAACLAAWQPHPANARPALHLRLAYSRN